MEYPDWEQILFVTSRQAPGDCATFSLPVTQLCQTLTDYSPWQV